MKKVHKIKTDMLHCVHIRPSESDAKPVSIWYRKQDKHAGQVEWTVEETLDIKIVEYGRPQYKWICFHPEVAWVVPYLTKIEIWENNSSEAMKKLNMSQRTVLLYLGNDKRIALDVVFVNGTQVNFSEVSLVN